MSEKAIIPEEKYEKYFRAHPVIVPIVSFLVLAGLYGLIVYCVILFNDGHYWSIIPAAVLAHSYFIISIHDGSHRSITHTFWDDIFMNVFAGLLLLPFFPEPFRKYHMIHHKNTNTADDPLWSNIKSGLFKRQRFLYVLCQFIPLMFTLVVLLSSEKSRKKNNIVGPKMRLHYFGLALLCSAAVLYFFPVPLFFYLGTLFMLTILGAIRHWCEHMGVKDNIESNTFWFPLGMGVGNHDLHHELPAISWLSLALGLRHRKRDTNPLKTVYQMIVKKGFKHYESD